MKQNYVTGISYSMVSSWKTFEDDVPDIISVSCDDDSKAAQIVDALTTNKNLYTNTTVTCADNRWIVRSCPMIGTTSAQLVMNIPSLCVNCYDPCAKTTQCRVKGPTLILAPCSSYSCDNDYKAIDVINILLRPTKATPSIIELIVTPERDRVAINGTLSEKGIVYCGMFHYILTPSH